MSKLSITPEELTKLYNKELNDLLDYCDWISVVNGETVCDLVSKALKTKGITVDSNALYLEYTKEVKSIGLTDIEWRKQYDIPKIIAMIHKIVEEKFGS